jgi:hypothetical protein
MTRATTLGQSVTSHPKARSLRFPAFITLALTITRCSRCSGEPMVIAAVIDGLQRHLDLLALSTEGLAAAVAERRFVAVVRPWGPPLANEAVPGHWWVRGIGEGFRPTLLAAHRHGDAPLPADVELSVALLTRFLPVEALVPDDAPCPF